MQVFKFGGASVKNAESVINVARIVEQYGSHAMVVVVSAMGKSTNALETMLTTQRHEDVQQFELLRSELLAFHNEIVKGLFAEEDEGLKLMNVIRTIVSEGFNNEGLSVDEQYSKAVAIGELLSTHIVAAYFTKAGIKTNLMDARKCIRTSTKAVDAEVNWLETEDLLKTQCHTSAVNVLQGFIASDAFGKTTTLGREGSDFTAAIAAYSLSCESVTIWKDVPGLLDADPKWFDNTQLIPSISYKEATELAYYGASVIHPKTLKPLQNKGIPLEIKSFLDPTQRGTSIQYNDCNDHLIPSFIFKMNQVLISISPRDFSFIDEANLAELFMVFGQRNIRVNVMQNTALTFSICIDNKGDWKNLLQDFSEKYQVRYNEGLELVTVRHYNQETIDRVTVNKSTLLEQRTRNTLQLVLEENN
jgi:aspartate kinase